MTDKISPQEELPVALYPVDKVTVEGKRQRTRTSQESLQELKKNIAEIGLLHPLIVSNGKLIAGYRRFCALKELYRDDVRVKFSDTYLKDKIPCIEYSTNTNLERFQVEYYENAVRVDLDWADEVRARTQLHEMRQAETPSQTQKRTAEEIAKIEKIPVTSAIRKLTRAVTIVREMDKGNMEVITASTETEAERVIHKQAADLAKKELAQRAETGKINNVLIHNTFYKDTIKERLQKASYDLLIVDPPYGISADTFRYDVNHTYKDSPEYAMEVMEKLAEFADIYLKEKSHVIVFFSMLYWKKVTHIWESHNYWVHEMPLIWNKGAGPCPYPNYGPSEVYETMLFITRGKKPTLRGFKNIFEVPSLKKGARKMGAQKPVELYRQLIETVCITGDRVIDPCCGTGTVFPAANSLGCHATGIEMVEETYSLALTRIEKKL